VPGVFLPQRGWGRVKLVMLFYPGIGALQTNIGGASALGTGNASGTAFGNPSCLQALFLVSCCLVSCFFNCFSSSLKVLLHVVAKSAQP
jgi:hypothetical protein